MSRFAPPRMELSVSAHDSTSLATDIYLPRAGHAVPTVLIRTPYGKANYLEEALFWSRHGLACAVQDVRGRYESEGTWKPYLHERDDGGATVGWLSVQPWSDGRVVASGSSYGAFTAWSAVLASPDLVCGVISRVPAMGLKQVKFDAGGMLRLADHVAWWLTYGDCRTERPRLATTMVRAEPEFFAHLPVIDLGDRLWADVPGWSRALEPAAARIGEYVSDEELAGLLIPTLHIGGWHDPLLAATLRQWEVAGAAAVPRPERSLIIGPWSHKLTATGTVLGDRDYGADSQIRLGGLEREWVSHVLGFAERPAPPTVHIFLMEENRWVNPGSWPPDCGGETIFYAAPRRALQAQQQIAIGSDTYCYDPRDPFPSRLLPSDRADLDARHDALRYISLPLQEELVIAGQPYVILDVESDCSSTDFVVRLLEQKPDGSVLSISRGCVIVDTAGECAPRACHRIPLTPTATMVRAGHRLRLEITSSDFPDLARNLNTGADRYRSADVRIARQRVWHGGDNPTRVILPTGGLP